MEGLVFLVIAMVGVLVIAPIAAVVLILKLRGDLTRQLTRQSALLEQ
jgi:hypothetical protein